MGKLDLEAMSMDDLWMLHEELSKLLSVRIAAEKSELEKRLAILTRRTVEAGDARSLAKTVKARRKYPRVLPKYRNPKVPSETWSGRGKQPRWLTTALKAGRKINDFKISDSAKDRRS